MRNTKRRCRLNDRRIVLVDNYRRCILCGVVWNKDRDYCPEWLRSEAEERLLKQLRIAA